MSAFIVPNATIDDVVETAALYCRGKTFAGIAIGAPFGTADQAHKAFTEIGKRLFRLNALAVSVRYRDEPDQTAAEGYAFRRDRVDAASFGFGDKYSHQWVELNRAKAARLYKSTLCLLYQCDQGDVAAEDLFGELKELCNAIARGLAASVPEVKQAKWANSYEHA